MPEDYEQESDPVQELRTIKADYDSLLQERNRILNELSSLGEALAQCRRDKAEVESSFRRLKEGELNPSFEEATNTRLKFLEQETDSLSRLCDQLESLLLGFLAADSGVSEKAREFIMTRGSLRSRIVLLVTEKGSIEVREIVRLTGLDQTTIRSAIEALLRDRSIMIHGSLLTAPSAYKPPDVGEWRRMPLDELFDEVEEYCRVTRSPELISQALQGLLNGVEQRVTTRTLVFEIGKEIQRWKRGFGSIEDLRYKIAEWKQRAHQ